MWTRFPYKKHCTHAKPVNKLSLVLFCNRVIRQYRLYNEKRAFYTLKNNHKNFNVLTVKLLMTHTHDTNYLLKILIEFFVVEIYCQLAVCTSNF